ncbi:hypothetical protein SSS_06729 [Sarcoptes scabiei]|uniref:Uncharacterized protein n=1 Tax=Sarcoptes scabiei TaxID=52283 RepID=A0A132AAQ6_SARSC|nr:hypothetical protein SSS_06729 [Sarcoptes scabiei]KPM07550.1 hypothetical protein QR98_0060470 [Sarcoptes scabiei]UXI14808.1 LIM domain kinase 1-like [Sarcoptes scabiei]
MDSNICEYIQQMIDIRLLIRHILDLVNSQTDCAGDDCVTNQDGLNEELRQITEPSTNLSIGYMLLAFLLMIMIMPLQQPLRRQRPTANPRNSNVEHQNHKPSSSHE